MRSKLTKLLAATFFATSILAMATPSAYAETSDPTSKKAKVTPADVPGCIEVTVDREWDSQVARLENECEKRTARVKILIAFGADSPCYILEPGYSREFRFAHIARFDGLVQC